MTNGLAKHSPQAAVDQFLLVEDAAKALQLDVVDLRRGIACGLIPIRRDNKGKIRVHQKEVPADLLERLAAAAVLPYLQVEVIDDELSGLREQLVESKSYRARLESLLEQQSTALDRSAKLLDDVANDNQSRAVPGAEDDSHASALAEANTKLQQKEAEISQLSGLLQRAFSAIEQRESQISAETGQLTGTTDKALKMLDRAISDGEKTAGEAKRLESHIDHAVTSGSRLEREIDQRNSVIDNQHNLMERLVSLSERSVEGAATQAPVRKRSWWQRLWGGRKGI